jgi:hypothetical protein
LFFCCFLTYGYILGLFGPSIPFLREATGTTLEQQSVLVTVRAIGFFSGSGALLKSHFPIYPVIESF